MGLTCSLLGHDFGDPEVEREREERGSEVVLTVREVATCARCGRTNVVTENKEVTTSQRSQEANEPAPDTGAAEPESVAADESGLDAEATSMSTNEGATGNVAEEDDAVIVEDEPESDERAHGEWPTASEPEEDDQNEPMEWPAVDSDDEGFDAQPSAGGDAAVEFGGGLSPERTTVDEEEDVEFVESAKPEPASAGSAGGQPAASDDDGGFVRVGAAPSPADPADSAGTDVDSEVVCPQCGFVDDMVGSSLRAGDICPDCRKGYLADQNR